MSTSIFSDGVEGSILDVTSAARRGGPILQFTAGISQFSILDAERVAELRDALDAWLLERGWNEPPKNLEQAPAVEYHLQRAISALSEQDRDYDAQENATLALNAIAEAMIAGVTKLQELKP